MTNNRVAALVRWVMQALAFVLKRAPSLGLKYLSLLLEWIVWVPVRLLAPIPERHHDVRRLILGLIIFSGLSWWTVQFLDAHPKAIENYWRANKEALEIVGVILAVAILVVGADLWLTPWTLFYHRRIKPIWEMGDRLGMTILALGTMPVVREVVECLRELKRRVPTRRCQTVLVVLYYLSIVTLPIQVFPILVEWQHSHFKEDLHDLVETVRRQWPDVVEVPVFTLFAAVLYLADWIATVAVFYAVVVNLARYWPRDVFDSIADVIRWFVVEERVFRIGAYYWTDGSQQGRRALPDGTAGSDTACGMDPQRLEDTAKNDALAAELHNETLDLDRSLKSTRQGHNVRVAVVFERGGKYVCIHYRRFGHFGFVVAEDDDPNRFYGEALESQINFQRFCAGIGRLIEVRESLK